MNMSRFILLAAVLAAAPVHAAERLTASRVGHDTYKLDDGRVAITSGCSVIGTNEDVILNDGEDTLTFIDDAEECDITEIK